MQMIIRNPTERIYPATGDYAHAIEIRDPSRLVYVAGTMGLDADGAAATTITEQLELIWANIGTILASADMTVDNIVRITAYLRSAEYAKENARIRVAALGGRVVPTTAIIVETLVPEWLAEIEVVAAG